MMMSWIKFDGDRYMQDILWAIGIVLQRGLAMAEDVVWYVVKGDTGHCEIVSMPGEAPSPAEAWGPFASQAEAIARRVGLIRAHKCKPRSPEPT